MNLGTISASSLSDAAEPTLIQQSDISASRYASSVSMGRD